VRSSKVAASGFVAATLILSTTLVCVEPVAQAASIISVSGQLVDASGNPVPDYPMWIGGLSTTTNSSGDFSVSGILSGQVGFQAGGQGLIADGIPAGLIVTSTIDLASSTSGLVFSLPPSISVSVTVVDTNNSPVPGANVRILDPTTSPGGWTCSGGGLPGGTNSCFQSVDGNWPYKTGASGQVSIPMVSSTGDPAVAGAQDPNDTPRAAQSAQFALLGSPSATVSLPAVISVSGQLVDASGNPVPDYPMWIGGLSTTTNSSGDFSFSGILAGSVNIEAHGSEQPSTDGLPSGLSVASTVSISSSTSDLIFRLPPIQLVHVMVQDTNGDPVSGALVRILRPSPVQPTGWDCSGGGLSGGSNYSCSQTQTGSYSTADSNGQVSIPMVIDANESAYANAVDPVDSVRAASGDAFALTGSPSTTVTLPSLPPLSPPNLAAAPLRSAAQIGWSRPKSDGGSALTGYTITASPSSVAASGMAMSEPNLMKVEITVRPSVTTVKLNDLMNGARYRITIVAHNSVGRSQVAATFVIPGEKAPTSTSLTTSKNPASTSTSIMYRAVVRSRTSPVLGGHVAFMSGAHVIEACESVLVSASGVAKCSVTYVTSGTWRIKAKYLGTGSYIPNYSNEIKEVVD